MNLEEIWWEFAHDLLKFIKSRVASSQDAEDILQEVFMKIQKNISSLNDQKKLKSWLYTITRNSIFDYYKRKRTHTTEFDERNFYSSNEESDLDEISRCLTHMIKALPKKYSEALIKVDLEGESQVGLAEHLRISFSGAKSRVQRGRMLLKKQFLKCCTPEFNQHGRIADIYSVKRCNKC